MVDYVEIRVEGTEGLRTIGARGEQPPCFREFSHRVGSSLQTVASLARRSEREILAGADQQTALAALRMVQRSVAAIVFVQRLLYADAPQPGATRDVITALSAHLKMIHDRHRVEVIIFEAADMPATHAQTIGLILCELITNALRHGFDEADAGTIKVSVDALPPATLRLTVEDNGKGCPAEPLALPERGLGLINEMAGDACGRLKRLKRDHGVAWQVDLPLG